MAFQVKYTHLMTTLIIFFMIIFVIDRFTSNVWPLYFTSASPIVDKWSASTFFIVGWICGRELIVASSFIFLLQCRVFWNWVFEHKPAWLLVDDIMIENNHMHYTLGWAAIAVPMLVHTWLVFLPLVQSTPVVFHSTWYRPIDHSLDPDFFVETYSHHDHHMHISINDLVALIILTITFAVVFPLAHSQRFRSRHWSIAQYMHQLAAFSYAVELLRTPLTAHCWFLCAPFILMYIVDRTLATFYYRYTDRATVVGQYNFDDKYILLCLWVPDIYYHLERYPAGIDRQIGDVFWLNTKGFAYRKLPQAAHPFTSFYNHNNSVPTVMDFLQSAEVRSDLAHPAHKFPIAKRKNKDEAVHASDLRDRDESFVLGRTATVAPAGNKTASVSAEVELAAHHENNSHAGSSLTQYDAVNIRSPQSITYIPEDTEQDVGDGDGDDEEVVRLRQKLDNDKIQSPPVTFNAVGNTQSVFINQNVHQDEISRGASLKADAWQWNVGFIIAVHPREDKYGFTERVAKRKAIKKEDEENYMMSYGPYRSSFANIIPFLNEETESAEMDPYESAIILIATGAGCSYMLDAILYLRGKFKSDAKFRLKHSVRIHFSCRSIRLFQWATNFLSEVQMENVQIFANLTSHKNIHDYDEKEDVEIQENVLLPKASQAKVGRASFKTVLRQAPHASKVFFCGHPRIQSDIKTLCKELHFTFYDGHSFG